jgi:hypothetical protein
MVGLSIVLFGQGIHQIEAQNHPNETYTFQPAPITFSYEKNNCTLDKMVFGWHPYWMNGAEANYQWNLLSDLCFFSYEVDASTGNALSTHGFSTNDAIDSALVHGTNVHLCVTLFSNHATFFGSTAAQNTLINNLVSLIQSRGAIGINIDFEGVAASQSVNFTNFMQNLSNALHSANTNYQLSMCLYAVDWSNVFNEPALVNSVDFFTLMGYDYYWTGSSQAGPNDPLYGFSSTYDYSLSRSISYYLSQGIPSNKLVLGLPYYGREWETISSAIPSATTGNNISSRTYNFVKNNASGLYMNPTNNIQSTSKAYLFQSSGTWRQCWISEENELKERYETIRKQNLKGIGIWALGYDDGYAELWDAINEKLTDCWSQPCNDTIYDEGGPLVSYYNNESYEYSISPPNASSIEVNFLEFSTEVGFDTLWIFDGASSQTGTLIGSYSGNSIPNPFTANTGQFTLKFKSDGSTRSSGWKIAYSCIVDDLPPVSSVSSSNWFTSQDTLLFTDYDNIQLESSFYNLASLENGYWKGNLTLGQVYETFNESTDWTNYSGNWSTNNGAILQTDQVNGNTNFALPYTPDTSEQLIFEWVGKISGTGNNRRAGMHFMCSDLSLPNRGNSYFIYLRADSDVIQWYKVTNDVFNLVHTIPYNIESDSVYDVKTKYSKITGKIEVYINSNYAGQWIDSVPLQTNLGLSLRSGGCAFEVSRVVVYSLRGNQVMVYSGNNGHFFSGNPNPTIPSGKLENLVFDQMHLFSSYTTMHNVDFTPPEIDLPTENYSDIDTFYNVNQIVAEHLLANDSNSAISSKTFRILNQSNQELYTFQVSMNDSSITFPTAGLSINTPYYCQLIVSNGAGLVDSTLSDGFILINNLSTENLVNQEIIIYPNPFANTIHILSPNSTEITIYDQNGRLLQTEILSKGVNNLCLEYLSSGIYLLKIGDKSYRVIKQ